MAFIETPYSSISHTERARGRQRCTYIEQTVKDVSTNNYRKLKCLVQD